MFIKGYTVPGVRLGLGLTQDTGRRLFERMDSSIRKGCNQKNTGEPNLYRNLFLNSLCCLSQIYQVNPSMTLDFCSYSKLTKPILSS